MRTRSIASGVAAVALVLAAAAAGSTATPVGAAAPTRQGLVLNYSFDADTGTVARDASANRIDARYVNTTAWEARSPGLPGMGRAITFVGSEHQYLSVPERDALDVDRFTLAALVRYTGVENDSTSGRWEVMEKAASYWMNVRVGGRVRVGGFFGGCTSGAWRWLDSGVAVPVDTWTHLAATYDGSRLSVWIDGRRAGSIPVSGRTCRNDEPLAIGAKDAPSKGLLEAFWDGQLDDVRIYRRALSASEIAGLLPA